MNRQEETAIKIYKTIQPSVINESEQKWWHEFSKEKAQSIIKNTIIPSLDYMCYNDADLMTEQVWWNGVIDYLKKMRYEKQY